MSESDVAPEIHTTPRVAHVAAIAGHHQQANTFSPDSRFPMPTLPLREFATPEEGASSSSSRRRRYCTTTRTVLFNVISEYENCSKKCRDRPTGW